MEVRIPASPALHALFQALPMDRAMAKLVVTMPPPAEHVALVERALADPSMAGKESLAAGLWLYIDDLDRSHKISQRHEDDPTFCYWHAIMHRREGDFSNSLYWFGRTGDHPAMKAFPPKLGYDARALVKRSEAAHAKGQAPAELVALQRAEWIELFGWCSR